MSEVGTSSVNSISLSWSLFSRDLMTLSIGESVVSPKFVFCNADKTWHLRLYPNGMNRETANCMFIALEKEEDDEPVPVTMKITLRCEHYVINKVSMENPCFPKISTNSACLLAAHDRIYIHSEFSRSLDSMPLKEEHNLAADLKLFLENCAGTDITLKSSETRPDDTPIKAHKALLMARSEVFKKMLTSDMLESADNTIVIDDMDSTQLESLMTFIYTDECPDIDEFADDLIEAAEKYMLPKLKEMCVHSLIATLTPSNAIPRLILGDLYNAPQLKDNCLKFIVKQVEDVRKTRHWAGVFANYHNLAALITDRLIEQGNVVAKPEPVEMNESIVSCM